MPKLTEGEERFLMAAVMFLERKIQLKLHPSQRGIRAPALDRGVLRQKVALAIEQLAGELADQVRESLPDPEAVVVPRVTGRYTTMDNTRPCDVCGITRRVAAIEYDEGEPKRVECEKCSPEDFRRKR